jgi:hypothetical protein
MKSPKSYLDEVVSKNNNNNNEYLREGFRINESDEKF